MKKWMINHQNNLRACSKLVSAMQPYLDYVIPCDSKAYDGYRVITLSVDPDIPGIQILVSPAEDGNQNILLTGQDPAHLFYAVCAFKTQYLPYVRTTTNLYRRQTYPKIFDAELPAYEYHSIPKIGQRGIWTWGHTIYDYRRFIDNMAELKMNTLIIWNDYVPTNIDDVIAYAHENYVKVYLGYAWGWDTVMPTELGADYLDSIIESALKTYRDQYRDVPCDGIYFQTVTEHKNEFLNGVSVAQAVVEMVNQIAGAMLEEQPDLKILFGLHATSVSNQLPDIARVDSQVSIIWENVGTFPWHYTPNNIDTFDQTLEMTRRIRDLRETGGFGGVLKGYINLDWTAFQHHEGPCPIGVSNSAYIEDLYRQRHAFDRYYQAVWLKYAPKALELIREFRFDSMMTVLVEDACFEYKINFPTALYAEMLWDSDRAIDDILYEVALNPDVSFA